MYGFQPRKSRLEPQAQQPRLGFRPGMNAPGADAALAQALNQQPDSIPGMFKPGEFVLPPDTVHAMGGKAALQSVVDQTHSPAPDAAFTPRGFKPRAYFANGGAPEDELQKPNSFGDAAAAASSPGTTVTQPAPAPAAAMSPSPSSPASTFPGNRLQGDRGFSGAPASSASSAPTAAPAPAAPMPDGTTAKGFMPATRAVYNESGKEISNLLSQGRYGAALGEAVRGGAAYVPAVVDDVVGGAVRTVGPGVMDAGKQMFGMNSAQATPAATSAAAPASQPWDMGKLAPKLGGLDREYANQMSLDKSRNPENYGATPTPAPAPAAATPPVSGMVTRDGNSYSGTNVAGDITINGAGPRNGGAVSARNDQAAENLAAGFRPGMGSQRETAAQPGLGFRPGGVDAPVVAHSGNDWQARKDLQNAATAAGSIMNRPTWQGTGMGRFSNNGQTATPPAVAAYQAMLQTDQALKQAQPAMDQSAMRENAATDREGMQQQGADNRAAMAQQGENYRAGVRGLLDRDRNQMDRERLGMEQTAQGFKTRAAQQMEDLQRAYLDPKSTPEQRAQAQQAIQALQGKSPEGNWKVQFSPAQKNADGSTTAPMALRSNNATGQVEVVNLDGQGAAPINKNQQALSIKNDTSLTLEQRADALRKLGYS